jgi:hypothetical protein
MSEKQTNKLIILRTGIPTKPSLALRVILVHFAAKTLQHQLLYPSAILSKAAIGGSSIKLVLMVCNAT